jgi:hypothetical protein
LKTKKRGKSLFASCRAYLRLFRITAAAATAAMTTTAAVIRYTCSMGMPPGGGAVVGVGESVGVGVAVTGGVVGGAVGGGVAEGDGAAAPTPT